MSLVEAKDNDRVARKRKSRQTTEMIPEGWAADGRLSQKFLDDLADKEQSELKIIEQYLPEQMDEEKIRRIVAEAIEETGADSPQKIGLVMKAVMPKVKGKADGKVVNRLVAELLAKQE